MSDAAQPHRLDLYRLSVQHPEAEAALLARIFRRHRKRDALTLKEDYAGTTAIAAAWVASHPRRQAVAVDRDAKVLRWGWRRAKEVLPPDRLDDLHLVRADVMAVRRPRVDVAAALNFSALYNHDEPALLRYLRSARASLNPGGVFVMDVFGGPGAVRLGSQRRRVTPGPGESVGPFTYVWEQKNYEPVTARIDCRIHYELGRGRVIRNAFAYDWRLWTVPELIALMGRAGFAGASVWCDGWDARRGRGDGAYRPVRAIGAREDFVAYVVGLR
ncbi:MAG: class I SAM-dependent methyltransferase [Planctomycetes bacterium]|nr:class I SAM-dependent methyltransferase [Planctomycetota bacterium]